MRMSATTARRTIEWCSAMPDEANQISVPTSTEINRRSRTRRRSRWTRATLTPPGTSTQTYVQRTAPIASSASEGRRAANYPSLAALMANPDRAVDVPVNQIAALVASLASEQARLTAIQGVLMTRLVASQPTETDESAERLLTAEEVAKVLGVTSRWVQRRARRLPFARRLSPHAVRYSESGLRRWMANRHMSTP